MKYEYSVKKIRISPEGVKLPDDGYTETQLFNEMGRKGFRYAGYHPTEVIGFGRVNTISLVFERCREDSTDER